MDGGIRPIKGVLSLTKNAKSAGFEEIFLPKANAKEAALIDGIKIFACEKLEDITNHFDKENGVVLEKQPKTEIDFDNFQSEILFDFSDIKGQETAKRGLEIAAAGGLQCDDVRSGRHRQNYAGQSVRLHFAALVF